MKCLICGEETKFDNLSSLYRYHISVDHCEITQEAYYVDYLKLPVNLCKVCGKPLKFFRLSKPFVNMCCSSKCSNSCGEKKNKELKTLIRKYGCANQSELQKQDSIQNKIKSSIFKRFGKEGLKSKSITDKTKATCLQKFGTEYASQSETFKEKLKTNNIIKYGVEHTLQLNYIRNKKYEAINDKLIKQYTEILSTCGIELVKLEMNNSYAVCKCLKCDNEFKIQRQLINKRLRDNSDICLVCNNKNNVSNSESKLFNFIKTISSDVVQSNRQIIKPLELDIYIPSKKIAIEFNGLYWHNELRKDFDYHLKKTEECEKQCIHLIHIYEDDWLYKQDIVKSRLKSLLGLSDRTIGARKCTIKELDNKTTKQFLEENHLQGGGPNSKYRYGLYHEDELVACMSFGNSRFEKGKIELHRFANKLNTNVIGGASRLFKHFINTVKPSEVISYANRSWTMNNGKSVYEQLGFKLIDKTKPNYSYIINSKRFDRFKFRKSELIKEGFDANKTEEEIMNERKIDKIYDSGSLKYKYC